MTGTDAAFWLALDKLVKESKVAIICTVDLLKRDSEIKVLLGCSEAEKDTIMRFCNDGLMKGIMIRRF